MKKEVLLNPAWFASDIANYLDCSLAYANEIKSRVESEVGCVPIDRGKKQTRVSADEVIKFIGGTDRLTEAKIYLALRGIENE